ncbi:MAG: glutathione S-transferase [Hyphomicrobiaceae bacterium]|jgi:glutathione S-transferase
MKLYYFPVAPNPTKVRLFLAEKAAAGYPIAIEEVAVSLVDGAQRSPEHTARNPMKRLPVLELDDGSYIPESLPIMEYLEELYPEPSLIGRTPRDRAQIRSMERMIETGIMNRIAAYVHATNSPIGVPPSEDAATRAREGLDQALPILEQFFGDGREFAAGDAPSIADCTLAAGFQFGRFGQLEAVQGYPRLVEWDFRYRERPASKAVLLG